MSAIVSPTSVPSPDERMVPARVAGVEIQVSCPVACVVDHLAENPHHIGDLHHATEPASVVLPGVNGPTPVLSGHLAWSPFETGPAPVFVFAPADEDPVPLTRTAALAVIDQLSAHINALRSVVEQMPKEVA